MVSIFLVTKDKVKKSINREQKKKLGTYSPGTSPVKYSGISERSKRPSGKKILLSGPEIKTKPTMHSTDMK